MFADKDAIVIIPRECFRCRPRVRFMESFPTRAAALSYAFQQGCNLIVESTEGSIPLFDVMQDPDGACAAGLDLKLVKTEDVLVEPASTGWTTLMLCTLWDIAKRLAMFLAVLYARQIVPLSRRAAAAVANLYDRQIDPLTRRAAAGVASLYHRRIVPFSFRTAVAADTYLGEAVLLFLRTAAFASLYFRAIVPILRDAAVRCWADSKSISRRHSWAVPAPRHSHPSQTR